MENFLKSSYVSCTSGRKIVLKQESASRSCFFGSSMNFTTISSTSSNVGCTLKNVINCLINGSLDSGSMSRSDSYAVIVNH